MIYLFFKNWAFGGIVFFLFAYVAISPSLITKYGFTNAIIDNVVRVMAIILFILWIIPHVGLFLDTENYLVKGDSYLRNKECVVKKRDNSVWFFFAQKSILCEGGEQFVDRFTNRIYYEGDVLKITYLPETTLIFRVDKVD